MKKKTEQKLEVLEVKNSEHILESDISSLENNMLVVQTNEKLSAPGAHMIDV